MEEQTRNPSIKECHNLNSNENDFKNIKHKISEETSYYEYKKAGVQNQTFKKADTRMTRNVNIVEMTTYSIFVKSTFNKFIKYDILCGNKIYINRKLKLHV